jgi:hypothetical protein
MPSVNIRLDEAQMERMERVAAALIERTGVEVTRSDIVRAVLKRGLEAFEREYKLDSGAAE